MLSQKRNRTRILGAACAAALTMIAAGPAIAGNGAIELSQSCAIQTGCMPGDAPGLPISINQPGAYVLTTALFGQVTLTDLIEVNSSDVTIDLNDFSLLGTTTCAAAGQPNVTNCTPGGFSNNGVVIRSASPPHRFVTIRNGGITGVQASAIDASLGQSTFIENVSVSHCGGDGIFAGRGSMVRNSQVILCAGGGVRVFRDSIVESTHVRFSGRDGFWAAEGALLAGVTALRSSQHGGTGDSGVVILDSSFFANGVNGIALVSSSLVSRTASYQNIGHGILAGIGVVIHDGQFNVNSLDGINCQARCNIMRNLTEVNGNDGIEISGSAAANVLSNNSTRNAALGLRTGGFRVYYDQNNLANNTGGATDGGGSSLSGGKNSCGGGLC